MAKAGTLPEEIARLVPLANAKSGALGKRTLSKRSLTRWHSERAAAGGQAAALAPKSPAPDMSVPPWAPALLALYNTPQKRSLKEIVEKYLNKTGALPMGIEPPSYDQAKRWLSKVSTITRNQGRMGSKELKRASSPTSSAACPAWTRSTSSSRTATAWTPRSSTRATAARSGRK